MTEITIVGEKQYESACDKICGVGCTARKNPCAPDDKLRRVRACEKIRGHCGVALGTRSALTCGSSVPAFSHRRSRSRLVRNTCVTTNCPQNENLSAIWKIRAGNELVIVP